MGKLGALSGVEPDARPSPAALTSTSNSASALRSSPGRCMLPNRSLRSAPRSIRWLRDLCGRFALRTAGGGPVLPAGFPAAASSLRQPSASTPPDDAVAA